MTAAAAQANQGMAATIGKKELVEKLGWTRPRLDRRLLSDRNFPVVNRGDQAGGWAFDLTAVRKYLGGAEAAPVEKKPPPIDKAQLRDAVAPPSPRPKDVPAQRRSAHHAGEATARQRKDEADASLRENKLKLENGELVERGELRQTLAGVMVSFAHDLDALPEKFIKAFELPEDMAPVIRTMIDQIRAEMVKRAEPLLADV